VNDSQLLVSRHALLHNVRLLRACVGPDVKLCATIKAGAYGHGAAVVADALTNFSLDGADAPVVDGFAVATLDEAAELPLDGHRAAELPVLVLRPVENVYVGRNREALEHAIRMGWQLTLISPAAADDVARVAMGIGRRASVHVMLDTGLTRCGACLESFEALLRKIESRTSLRLTGVASHFANSDTPDHPFTAEQIDRFLGATGALASARKVTRHLANTGGMFFSPRAHLDMVRPGLGLYGIDPSGKPSLDRPLRPVMKWVAPLVAVHEVKRGTTVGYGQTWTAVHDTRVGLVPVGYADGYLRAFSNRGVMVVQDRAVPVVGRVSMDYTMLDLGPNAPVTVGEQVTVLDNDPLSPVSAYALARIADTIPYELFTRIGPRVRRTGVDPADSDVSLVSAEGMMDD
jgi:alanine racemase